MRSAYQPGNPTNLSTHILWNNSTGPSILVVRAVTTWDATLDRAMGGLVQATAGTHLGVESPFIAGGQIGPGQHYYQDTATVISNRDLLLCAPTVQPAWNWDFPICALQPGFGLAIQCSGATHPMSVGFFWEYLYPGDLYFSDLLDEG